MTLNDEWSGTIFSLYWIIMFQSKFRCYDINNFLAAKQLFSFDWNLNAHFTNEFNIWKNWIYAYMHVFSFSFGKFFKNIASTWNTSISQLWNTIIFRRKWQVTIRKACCSAKLTKFFSSKKLEILQNGTSVILFSTFYIDFCQFLKETKRVRVCCKIGYKNKKNRNTFFTVFATF